ncbi:hypothetical protein Hdeb2414_s0015g00442401 [Helianthus debilis subsp. tardiflorus]
MTEEKFSLVALWKICHYYVHSLPAGYAGSDAWFLLVMLKGEHNYLDKDKPKEKDDNVKFLYRAVQLYKRKHGIGEEYLPVMSPPSSAAPAPADPAPAPAAPAPADPAPPGEVVADNFGECSPIYSCLCVPTANL